MILIKERIGKLVEDLNRLIYAKEMPITSYRMLKSGEHFLNVQDLHTDDWEELTSAELWGGHREYFWFETVITIPDEFKDQCVVYELKTGREGLWDATNPQFTIYVNGVRRQGLDVNHREVLLTEKAAAGETFRIVLSAFTGDQNLGLVMDSRIKVLDRETEQYYYDISVPYQVARLLPDSDSAYLTILHAVNESLNLLDLRKEYSGEYYESLKKAREYMKKEFYDKYCKEAGETIYCVGHTHIDVAWLWTLAVTEDKAVRSFSTVLELMKQYPEYIFMSSQPQLYKYVKKNAPEVYEEIQKRVAEGRWETEGGMFVEADCNLSSGESLVRQFLHGKEFFREEFGKDNEILWLPDVFGYSAALPQIMKKCGIKYFMTTKISWNEFNKMPYDTFEWEGIDGTRILTHFSPSRDYHKVAEEGGTETEHFTTYNAYINPSQVKGAWARYSQKYLNDEVLMSFGYGDGGGGPTKDMLENQRRLEKGIPGCPRTVMSTSKAFFEKLDKEVRGRKYLPAWVGELYLEYHRGTYTSMARNKKYNRKSEFLFENAECYSMLDGVLNQNPYPREVIEDAWEVILRNQFHDILPGSSIKEVYEDSRKEYETIGKTGRELVDNALIHVTEQVDAHKGTLVVFNPNSLEGEGAVSFQAPEHMENLAVMDGEVMFPAQKAGDGSWLFCASQVPSKGYKTFELREGSCDTGLKADERHLENEFIRVTFHENGQISSIYDKQNEREVLKENRNANVLMTYEDRPHNYDAWDVNNYYVEKSWEITDVSSMELVENGPVRATICVKRRYLDSDIEQYISLLYNSPEITIRNEIDWKENHIFLKSILPVDIHTDEATFEIQYGNVKRKTHYNTMWDYAKFEVCMHKWIDVSEDDYGVSMINDCKYGCHVHDGEIGISMLKSATYPNPDADKEHHSFVFSIYPHKGDWKKANTIQKAYSMNNPMTALVKEKEGGQLPREYSLVKADAGNVVIEVVKQSQKGNELILRFYETNNRRTSGNMSFGMNIQKIMECNMLEEDEAEVNCQDRTAAFVIQPYEIKTWKVTFR
jgi:alpha-mannosidase